MIPKFNHCGNVSFSRRTGVGYCPPTQSPGPGAIPESQRIQKKECGFAYVTTYIAPQPCYLSTSSAAAAAQSGTQKIAVPVSVGSALPIVPVGTQAASVTVQQRAEVILREASDPYNPATRFSQYFPPAPIPYICPERIPNNLPIQPTPPCFPPVLFHDSKWEVQQSTIVGLSTLAALASTIL